MFKHPKLYAPAKGEWYVHYQFFDAKLLKFVRIKKKLGLNRDKLSTAERRRAAADVIKGLVIELSEGYNPLRLELVSEMPILEVRNARVLIEAFLQMKELTVRRSTFLQYKSTLGAFSRFLPGDIDIQQIDKNLIRGFLKPLYSRLAGNSYNHYLVSIKIFFNYHVTQTDYIIKNPALGIEKRKFKSVGNVPLSDSDMKRVKEYFSIHSPETWLLCQVIYYEAMRPHQEVRLLKRKHIDFKRMTITLPGEITKSTKPQTIPLDPILARQLNPDIPEDHYIFGGINPRSVFYTQKRWRQCHTALNLPKEVGIYGFKHLRAQDLYRAKVDIELIKTLFRHSSSAITQIYLRGLGEMTDASMLLLSREL